LRRVISKFWRLQQFLASARRRGIWRTLHIAAYEIWYDCKFGLGTGSVIAAEELDIDAESRSHSQDYFPSSYLLLHETLVHAAIDLHDHIFIDYGCGMGRALLFASTLPFREIVGIELSPTLATAARRNLAAWYAAAQKAMPIWRVETVDARLFEVPPEATVFYFFNPFDAVVLGPVADRIAASLKATPRRCLVIYVKPLHEAAFLERGFIPLPQSTVDYTLFSFAAVA
jgi:SAM-dependent methyltransferase